MTSVLEGGCACGAVRYELHGRPMIVHACHCTNCRRLSGSVFSVNAWTEVENIVLLSGELSSAELPGGESGKPCEFWFCDNCGGSVWRRYHGSPGDCRFLNVATLDDPSALQPDVHIFTRSKLAWAEIPEGTRSYAGFYDLKDTWSADSLKRLRKNIEKEVRP